MAVDLSIEVFAYDLFNAIWIQGKIIGSAPPSSEVFKEHCGEPNFNEDILKAVNCRQLLFHDQYQIHFEDGEVKYFGGPSDFFEYISYMFEIHFKDIVLFDLILATCAYIAELGLYCCSNGNFSFLKYAYLCWAMYVDTQLKSQFYEHGGWFLLKYTAKTYSSPLMILNIHKILGGTPYLGKVPLDKFISGIGDFDSYNIFTFKQINITAAKTWVSFQVENEISQHDTTANRADLESKYKNESLKSLEEFLLHLKFLCNPLRKRLMYVIKSSSKNLNLEDLTSSESDELNNNTGETLECAIISGKRNNYLFLDDTETNASFKEKLVWHLKNFGQKECVLQTSASSEDMEDLLDAEDPPICELYDLTPCLTTENLVDNQKWNVESTKSYLNTAMSKCEGQFKSQPAELQILEDKCIAYDGDGEEEIKNVNTGAIPKTKPTSKDIKNSNDYSPKSKAPTAGHETSNAVKNKKKKKRKGVKSKAISPIPVYVIPDGTSKPNSYPDETKDFLRMLLVLGCQPGLNYMQSTLNNTKK